MKKPSCREQKKLRDAIREATIRFLELEGVQSGLWAACSAEPQWLVSQRFPSTLIEPMVENCDGIQGVSILSLLWKLADVFGADTSVARQCALGRKRCGRQLAESIKAAVAQSKEAVQ